MRRAFLPLITILVSSATAHAGFYFQASGMRLESNEVSPSTTGTPAYSNASSTQTSRTLIDVGLGYMSDGGWVFGVKNGQDKAQLITKDSTGTSTTTDTSRNSFGPSVGWMSQKDMGGPFIIGTYFTASDYTASTSTFKGGGFQIDLGMRFAIKKAALTGQLSYKSFGYTKHESTGWSTEMSEPLQHTFLDPYFGIAFMF